MKALVLSLLLILGYGAFYSAQAQTEREVRIRINQQKTIAGRLTMRVVAVEDSRCPADTQCVWAGNAKVRVRMTNGRGAAQVFELNTNLQPETVRFAGYDIKLLDVTPRPASNIRINRNGYAATFAVTKL